MTPTLAVDGLGYSYPSRAGVLDDVTFSVARGEAVAIIGPSGAGKSTLFRTIAHLAAPDAGSIALDGVRLYDAASARRVRGAIGYVHQQHGLPPAISAAMAVLGGEMHGWGVLKVLTTAFAGPDEADLGRVREVMRAVGLGGRELERVGEMSVGQRQRVAVARTLLQAPRLIVADEPVASVDPTTADGVLGLLAGEAARGAVVLCSVHDIDRARRHFPRVIGLRCGRVVFDGPAGDLTDAIAAAIYRGEDS